MIRWFHEVAPLGQKMTIALTAVIAPMAMTWAVTALEYFQLSQSAAHEAASNYMQVLRFGMDTTLGVSTAAMLASLVACQWMRGRLVEPIVVAVEALDALAAGDLSERETSPRRTDEAGRIMTASALLRRNALAARQAAEEHAAREAVAAAERERIMAALAEGLGVLAASNRQLRGAEPAPTPRPVLRPAPPPPAAVPAVHAPWRDEEPAEGGLVDLLRRLDQRRPHDSGLRLVSA